MPHLVFTLFTAVLLSAAMALIGMRPMQERVYAATYLFLTCVAATVAGSWAMYLIHG